MPAILSGAPAIEGEAVRGDPLRTPNKTGNGGARGLFWAAWPSLSYPTNCGP
jgi:hypothetical protein